MLGFCATNARRLLLFSPEKKAVNFPNTVIVICFFLFLYWSEETFGQTILAWDLYGFTGSEVSINSTTTDVYLNTSSLSRGAGLNTSALGNSFSSKNWNTAAALLSDAVLQNDYFQFSVNAKVGDQVSLTTLNAKFRRSATGPINFQWEYSLDGFATAGITISSSFTYTLTTTNGDAQAAVDLSGISALQNLPNASTATFRLYGWGASATAGTFAFGVSTSSGINSLSLIGTTSAITTYTTFQNGDWNTASTWSAGIVPPMGAAVIINHSITLTSPLTNTGSVTVSSSGLLALSSTYTDSGATSVNGTLQLNSGGGIANNSPTYGSGSMLQYNSGGNYGRSVEWNATSGAGYPYNVQVSNNTTVDLGANSGNNVARQIAGNLTIDLGATLSMNATAMTQSLTVLGSISIYGTFILSASNGGDLNAGGNWIMGASGVLTPNSRTVTFNGSSGTQLLTGNSTFYNLTLNNAGATTDFGSTTITITHNFTNSAGTMNGNASTIIFTGNPGNILGNNSKNFYNIQLAAGASISHTGSGNIHVSNDFRNDGTFSQASTLTTFFDKSAATETLSGSPVSTIFGNVTLGKDVPSATTTLNAGAHTFTIIGGALTLYSSSTFNGNTSTVNFTTTNVTVSGTGAPSVNFYNITTNVGVDFGTISTILNGGAFTLNSGGYVNNVHPPTYANGSTLIYNANYNRYDEWQAGSNGAGVPYHVQVNSSYTLNMDANGSGARTANGNLTLNGNFSMGTMLNAITIKGSIVINSSAALSLSASNGGDIYVGGNWTLNAGATFSPNSRAVFFNGSSIQNITNSSAGTINFDYLGINNSSASGVQLSSGTNIYVSTLNGGNGLQLLNIGPLDLNGNTCTIGSNNYGTIEISGGVRNITSSSGTGIFVENGGTAASPPIVYAPDASTLTFGSNVRVELNKGFDFGSNLTTINGTLRLNQSSFVSNNAPTYGTGSLLQYYTNGVYNRTIEWGASSGPGYPYNVELGNNTTLNPGGSSNTAIALDLDHNLTIDAGSSLYMDYGGNYMSVPLEVGNDVVINGNLSLSQMFGGDILLGGNWLRASSGNFYPNFRAAFFNGSLAETISVTGGGTETFDYLVIDNPAGVSLSSSPSTSVNINYGLTLTNGIVSTGTNQIYVKSTASNAISGYKTDPTQASYTSSSRINGNLRRNVVVNTNYDFPVGTSSNYDLATLKFSNIASITDVLGYFTSGSSGTFTGCEINYTQIIDMLNGGYWTLTPTGSTTGANYDLTLYETGYTNFLNPPSTMGLIKRSNSTLPWSGTDYGSDGVHVNSTQQVYSGPVAKAVRTSIPTFSDYAIGFSNNIVLPIELTDFTVSASGNDARLWWNTSSEINSDYFGVERSFDGEHFTQIGAVIAAGYSTMPLDYSFTDKDINKSSADKIYYRLRMVDQDQSYKYSSVRWLDLYGNADQTVFNVFPNPFNDAVSITLNSVDDGIALLELSDLSGKIIFEQSVKVMKGNNFLTLNQFSSLAQGVYVLQLIAGSAKVTRKMIKE